MQRDTIPPVLSRQEADPYLLAGRADRLLKLHQHLLHPVDAEMLGDLAHRPIETLA
jgi:hypothetical protein